MSKQHKKPYAVTYHREGWPKQVIVKRFVSEKGAESFIDKLKTQHGDADVEAGFYGIDGPGDE